MPPDGRRLLLDQNVPQAVAAWLRELLEETLVEHINELGMAGAKDPAVFALAQRTRAVIVTFDEDFADRRTYPPGSHCGVIRLRVEPTTIEHTIETLDRLFRELSPEALFGKLTIIDESRIRLIG